MCKIIKYIIDNCMITKSPELLGIKSFINRNIFTVVQIYQ